MTISTQRQFECSPAISGTTGNQRDHGKEIAPGQRIRLKIFGVGGAGGHTISQIAEARSKGNPTLEGVDLIAINTDVQALDEISGAEKLQIGAAVTHGLGAGGEPEIGARAAQNDAERIEALAQGANVVFITAGLGGGTSTGASPTIARIAKEQGALVLAFVALPFSFEGDRRKQQALSGLEQLKSQADAVICIPERQDFADCRRGRERGGCVPSGRTKLHARRAVGVATAVAQGIDQPRFCRPAHDAGVEALRRHIHVRVF